MRENAEKNTLEHQIMKYLFVLALLPTAQVPKGVKIVKDLIKENFKNNATMQKRWILLIRDYYEGYWMKQVKPEVFCVFNQVDRTNNYVESNNHLMKGLLHTKPSCYTFMGTYSR